MSQHVPHPSQRSVSSKNINTNTHIHRTDCSTWASTIHEASNSYAYGGQGFATSN